MVTSRDELLPVRDETCDVGGELVVGFGALAVAQREQVVERAHERADLDRAQRGRRNRSVCQPVVVLVQLAGDGAQVVEAEAEEQPGEQRVLELGIGEEVVDERRPVLVERDPCLDVVEHLESGREARLERVLGEDALREAVQRGERRVVELLECLVATYALGRVDDPVGAAGGGSLELAANPVAQLRCGRLRERDRGQVAELQHAGSDERYDAVDERGRLARAGARLDEEAGIVRVAHSSARFVVDRRAHTTSSSSPSGRSSESSRS